MKTELTSLAKQREIKCREEIERADVDLDINFLIFCCSLGPSLKLCSRSKTPSQALTPKGSRNYWPSSHRHFWCSTVVFTSSCLVVILRFSCFLSRIHYSNSFSVWVPSSQLEFVADLLVIHFSIFNLGICCYDDLDLGNLPLSHRTLVWW